MDLKDIKNKTKETIDNLKENELIEKIKDKTEDLKEKYNEIPYANPALAEIAYPLDEDIAKKMRFAYVDKILNKPLEKLIALQYGITISQSLEVNEINAPEIYSILKECCEILKIDIPFTVIDNNLGMNACTIGTDAQSFIMITNMLSEFLNEKQLKFIIGHECGHIAMKHMLFHTAAQLGVFAGQFIPVVGPYVSQFAGYPIRGWSRCSEITADRLGLLCCQDLHAAQSALLKLVVGFRDVENLDINQYISSAENSLQKLSWGKYMEGEQTHPLIFKRLKALELFYNSEVYYNALGLDYPTDKILYTKDELNKKTKEILRI